MPQFQLHPATEADFPELISTLWESFETPRQGLLRLFFPILDNDRPGSLQTCIAGQLDEVREFQKPGAPGELAWVKIVDTHAQGRIVAAAKWFFYHRDPNEDSHAENPEGIVADWYPEGVAREFATSAVRLFERPREEMARRAHAFLHIAFTVPTYRGRGLARMFMEWGLRIADERGLEAWLDASEFGAPLYENFGFRRVLVNAVVPVPGRELGEDERREWEECEAVMLPIVYTLMWRPKGGVFVEGAVKPWEVDS
ncbi:acyl-CoA N-acyltransferase [Aspergillus californicus]